MPWPLSQDYNEAIQTPAQCFSDPDLRQGEAVCNEMGMPEPCSGNFADVYAVQAGQRKWAVKCFTRQIPGLKERYAEVSKYLQQVKLPFMVDFQFMEQGIRVRGTWYPILKMQWVEGFPLNDFVRDNLDKPQVLQTLCQMWLKLAVRLREANLAHCDLQHGNVLLVPGNKANALSLKLVDYDGMCVPALEMLKSIEVGHAAYQHPQRLRDGTYGLQIDRFPHLVIYTALRCLAVGGRRLWEQFDNGDNLLFIQKDFENPRQSRVFQEVLKLNDPEIKKLVQALAIASQKPIEQVPLLDDLVALPKPKTAAVSAASTPTEKPVTASPFAAIERTGYKPKKKRGLGIALVSMVVFFGLAAAGAAWFLTSGGRKGPGTQVAQGSAGVEDTSRKTTASSSPRSPNATSKVTATKTATDVTPPDPPPVTKKLPKDTPTDPPPVKEKPPNKTETIPAGKTIDLLKLVKLERDTVKGNWSFRSDTLVSPDEYGALMQVPYIPPDEYNLKAVVERKSGTVNFIGFIAKGKRIVVQFDDKPEFGWRTGIDKLDGKGLHESPIAHKGAVFKNDTPSEIIISVRKAKVGVTVDGKNVVSFTVDSSRLFPSYEAPNKAALFVGSYKSIFHFRKLELTPVTGEGRLLYEGDQGKPIDLLKSIDPKRDAVQGNWTFDGKTLVAPPGDRDRLQIPYIPPEEYKLSMVVERKQGEGAFLAGIRAGGRQFLVVIAASDCGLELLDSKFTMNNETTHKGQILLRGMPTEIDIVVRKTSVTVAGNGKPLIAFKGDYKRLSLNADWSVPDKNVLFLGIYNSPFHISKMELTPISGQGKVLADSERGTPHYLFDMKEYDVVAHEGLGKGFVTGGGDTTRITVNGSQVPHCLGLHPPSPNSVARVRYKLDKRYGTFVSEVAINDTAFPAGGGAPQSPLTFEVYGDGRMLWTSKPLQAKGLVEKCKITVTGISVLELRVNCPGGWGSAHAVWLEPRLFGSTAGQGKVEPPMTKKEEPAKPPKITSLPLYAFKSKRAADAKVRYDEVLKQAKDALVAELREAVKEATKKNDLNTANSVQDLLTYINPPLPADRVEFEGRLYKLFTEKVTWHVAKARCELMGGYFACIENEQQNRFLVELAQNTDAWFGASDEETQGRWKWVNGQPVKFSGWHPGEPNNGGGTEHHAHLWPDGGMRWFDTNSGSRKGFLCQWDKDKQIVSVVEFPWSLKSKLATDAKSKYLKGVAAAKAELAGQLQEAAKEALLASQSEEAATHRTALDHLYRPVPKDRVRFGTHYYKVIKEKASWHRAMEICGSMGGYLACISTAQEDAFVRKLIGRRPEATWLGGSDEVREGQWQWVNGQPWRYSNWEPGEPSNSGGIERHLCVYWENRLLRWNDAPAGHRFQFVCQWDK